MRLRVVLEGSRKKKHPDRKVGGIVYIFFDLWESLLTKKKNFFFLLNIRFTLANWANLVIEKLRGAKAERQ